MPINQFWLRMQIPVASNAKVELLWKETVYLAGVDWTHLHGSDLDLHLENTVFAICTICIFQTNQTIKRNVFFTTHDVCSKGTQNFRFMQLAK